MFSLFVFSSGFGQTYVIIADRIIDCRNGKQLDNPVIVVQKNRIADIRFDNRYPDSAIVIDLKGYSLLPGLIDVHTHILAGTDDYDKDLYKNSTSYRALRAAKHLSISLQNGFTTLRDVCTEGAGFADVDISRAIDSGFIIGPRVIPSGRGIAATNRYVPFPTMQNWELDLPSGAQYATGIDECTKAVREQVSRGVECIKLFSDWGTTTFNYEEISTVVKEARKYNIPVAAHATSREAIRMAILAGVRSIEHGEAFDDSLIHLAVKNNVYWSPTISVYESYHFDLTGIYKQLNNANKAKLKIVCGTDIGSFPWTINQAKELEYYVKKGGLSPMDAIRTATVNAAELLSMETRIGSLEKGFIADIIAVKGNPLNDITLLQNISFVMKEGKIYKH
jgi:imidazolonepropionase-like amidohydrolase